MSGHKRATVKVDQQDLHRLEQLGERVRQVEQDYQDIQVKLQQRRAEQLTQVNQQLEQRQNAYNLALDGYQNEISRLEQETSQALLTASYAWQDDLEQSQAELSRNLETLIDQHSQSIQQVLLENQQQQSDHFFTLKQALDQSRNENDQKAYLAQEALEGAYSILQSICQVYPHERYYPGAFSRLQMEYAQAAQNLQNGMPEAALFGAQQVCQQTSILRLSIEEILQNTALMQSIAVEKTTEILLKIEHSAVVPAVDLDGNLLETGIAVDHWSGGRLSSLHRRCTGFLSQLSDPASELEYEDLERITRLVLPQLEHSLQDIIAQSRLKVILSQIRFNIAQRIVDALAEQGFEVQQAVYHENDERQPYQLVTRNLEGSEVQVCVDSGEQVGSYQIQIDSAEAVPCSEAELRQRAHEVLHSLHALGLNVGQIQELKGTQKPPFVVQSRGRMPRSVNGMIPYVH